MPNKKPKKANKKDAQLVIRMSAQEREAFVALCEKLDSSASREVRRFVKNFLERRGEAQQK